MASKRVLHWKFTHGDYLLRLDVPFPAKEVIEDCTSDMIEMTLKDEGLHAELIKIGKVEEDEEDDEEESKEESEEEIKENPSKIRKTR